MAEVKETGKLQRVPIRAGLLFGSLDDLASVHLSGCRCSSCGETSLGGKSICPNCGRDTVSEIPLGDEGTLWTFTVIRFKPPGDYRGPDPFVPYGLGLVELGDGLRVFAPIRCDIDQLKIGIRLKFRPYVRVDPDREVVAFAYEIPNDGGDRV
jgi:uncharacterized protein